VWPSIHIVSTIPNAVSGLTNDEAAVSGVVLLRENCF